MSFSLVVRPDAEFDLAEARDWYDQRREGLGDEFLLAVQEVFVQVENSPTLHAAEYRNVRRARIKRFPYVVYYRIIGERIEVLAVLHGHRHSRVWRSRA